MPFRADDDGGGEPRQSHEQIPLLSQQDTGRAQGVRILHRDPPQDLRHPAVAQLRQELLLRRPHQGGALQEGPEIGPSAQELLPDRRRGRPLRPVVEEGVGGEGPRHGEGRLRRGPLRPDPRTDLQIPLEVVQETVPERCAQGGGVLFSDEAQDPADRPPGPALPVQEGPGQTLRPVPGPAQVHGLRDRPSRIGRPRRQELRETVRLPVGGGVVQDPEGRPQRHGSRIRRQDLGPHRQGDRRGQRLHDLLPGPSAVGAEPSHGRPCRLLPGPHRGGGDPDLQIGQARSAVDGEAFREQTLLRRGERGRRDRLSPQLPDLR